MQITPECILAIIGLAIGLYLCLKTQFEIQESNNNLCTSIIDLLAVSLERKKEEELEKLALMYPNPVERQWIIEGREKRMRK